MPFRIKKQPVTAFDEQLDHQRLTSLINSMADAVLAVDENVKVVLYNGAALNILDVNNIKNDVQLADIFKPLDRDNRPFDIEKMVKTATKPVTSRDLKLQYADTSQINLYLSIAPVHLGYGKEGQHGYVLLLRDITHEKSLEEERDEFISVVSHELRTPIAVAEGNISNAQLIAEKGGDAQAITQALKDAHSQIMYLSDMVNDLSTLSRAERNKLQVEIESIDARALTEELTANYQADAHKKGLTLSNQIHPQLGTLQSSKLYVHEVLQNFITNAIKYTETGSVTVIAKPSSDGVEFTIQDTGIGISKSDQEKVFDKFFRSEDFRTRQSNGTGLGLYVTKKLANLIHADIKLSSELNKGSTFTITFPNLK